MPNRDLHDLLTRLLLHDSLYWVSRFMDQPYALYRGRHRRLRHDTSVIIRMLEKHGVRSALAAWLHLVLDENGRLKRDVETLSRILGDSERKDQSRTR